MNFSLFSFSCFTSFEVLQAKATRVEREKKECLAGVRIEGTTKISMVEVHHLPIIVVPTVIRIISHPRHLPLGEESQTSVSDCLVFLHNLIGVNSRFRLRASLSKRMLSIFSRKWKSLNNSLIWKRILSRLRTFLTHVYPR